MGEDLGQELVKAGLVTAEHLDEAAQYEPSTGQFRLPRILIKLGFLKEADYFQFMARREGLEVVGIAEAKPDAEMLGKLPAKLVQDHALVPLSRDKHHLRLALPDPSDLTAIEEVRFLTGLEVQPVLIAESDALKILSKHYSRDIAPRTVARGRSRADARKLVREIGQKSMAEEGVKAGRSADASSEKLVKVLTALLIEKGLIDGNELARRLAE